MDFGDVENPGHRIEGHHGHRPQWTARFVPFLNSHLDQWTQWESELSGMLWEQRMSSVDTRSLTCLNADLASIHRG